ncbi:hypothetical protein EYR36_003675 [Pleurotus pulmonarius]|nr:hypothetical protein EYR36_003675 [Pleurotus pulmonarius]
MADSKDQFSSSTDSEKNDGVSITSVPRANDTHSQAFERRTMRLVDFRVLPLLAVVYAIALIDRINLGVARTAGMGADLNLTVGSRFSIVTCLYFIPYILGYKRYEVQKRLAAFYLSSITISGFSPIIAYGISLLDGKKGIAGWEWIFVSSTFLLSAAHDAHPLPFCTQIIEGAITIALGLILFYALPDFPDKNTFLTPEQTAFVLKRVEDDRGDSVPDKITFKKILTHLGDWTIWAYGIVGLALMAYAPQNGVRYFGTFLVNAGSSGCIPGILAYGANNVVSQSKRVVQSAVTVAFGGIGGIIASTVFREVDRPKYVPGLWVTLGMQVLIVVLVGVMNLHFKRMNRLCDEGKLGGGRKVLEGQPGFRKKPRWPFKLLDESKGLAAKWAMEAQLLDNEEAMNDGTLLVVQAIRDLKTEASRIVALDYSPQLLQTSTRVGEGHRDIHFQEIDKDVTNTLKFVRTSEYSIVQPKLREEVGVFVTDDLVPRSLHSELVHELDLVAKQEPKDIHPGSGGKVQDLIHPSLYPYMGGISPVNPGVTLPRLEQGEFRTAQFTAYDYEFASRFAWIPSIFHVSDDGRDVHIESYINGLGPRERHSDLYRLIEKVFLVVLPQLERTKEWDYSYKESSSEQRWMERREAREGTTRADWLALLDSQAKSKEAQAAVEEQRSKDMTERLQHELDNITEFHGLDDSVAAVPEKYRGKRLKVIVKAANYVLQPGQEYVGTWHMEGMPHEQIVASAIYYYQADPEINDQGLSFRRRRAEDDFPSMEEYRHEDFDIHFNDEDEDEDEEDDYDVDDDKSERDYPSDWEYTEYDGVRRPWTTTGLRNYIDLGTVQATGVSSRSSHPTGRIITFPNWIQHKVAGISHSSADPAGSAASRKILCFFLVDDEASEGGRMEYRGYSTDGLEDMDVLTTSDVPWQARPCNIRTLHSILLLAFKRSIGKEIPAELRNYIVSMATEGTITREEAEKRRRELMEDRKFTSTGLSHQFWLDSGAYSLCEH